MIEVYIDGASVGNPGKMGIGYVLYKDKALLKRESIYLGIGTNNFAEYCALIAALMEVLALGEKNCSVYTDSKLLCEQIKGNFKVKSKSIYPLFILLKETISKFRSFKISHTPREKNKEADRLAKQAASLLFL